MPQTKMTKALTLFPDFIALVPLEAIAGSEDGGTAPTITDFASIDKTNSFVVNDVSADTDLVLNENGVQISYAKTSSNVMAFDAGGLGNYDDVTTQRECTITLGLSGLSHNILAILLGLDPTTDIKDDFVFHKDDASFASGVEAAGINHSGNIKKKKFFFIARIPLENQAEEGELYVVSPKVVAEDQDISVLMQNQHTSYNLPLKGLKLLSSAQLSSLQTFAEPIANGFEMLFFFNAAEVAVV